MGTPASHESLLGDTGITLYGGTETLIRDTWREVIRDRPNAMIAHLAGYMFNRLPTHLVHSVQVKGDEVRIEARTPDGVSLFLLRKGLKYMTVVHPNDVRRYDQKVGVVDGPGAVSYILNTAFEAKGIEGFLAVLKNIVREKGYAKVAKKAGLSETTVRRAFAPGYSPTLTTIHNILWALGAQIKFSVTGA